MFSWFNNKKSISELTPKDHYINQITDLLEQYAQHIKDPKKYIQSLCELFLSRKITIDDQTASPSLLSLKYQLELEASGNNALIVSEAIARKIDPLLKKQPRTYSLVDTYLYLVNHVPHSLPHMITWVYDKSLKKDVNRLDLWISQFPHLNAPEFTRLNQILEIFNIKYLKFTLLGDTEMPPDSIEWQAFFAILAKMKRIDLDNNNLGKLSNEHLLSLAHSLSAATTLDVGRNFKNTEEDKNRWEAFMHILLNHSTLTTLVIDDVGINETFYQQLRSSSVLSLTLIRSASSQQARQEDARLNNIIRNNNTRHALSLEHGGLKRLIAYSIWNNPKTTRIYEKNKSQLPIELKHSVDSMHQYGVFHG